MSDSKVSNDLNSLDDQSLKWPFRWAVILGVITFPLIWAGGLVTSTDAGMAVPDWPNTYGYNMFSYPFASWFFGPWDLFIEHGHRLLGSLAGVIAIILVAATFRCTLNSLFRWMAVGALVLVIIQGALGGVRVLAADRVLAMVHGCVGPAFFAYTAALATLLYRKSSTNQTSITRQQSNHSYSERWFPSLTVALTLCSFLQLVLGANLRHIEETASFHWFRQLVVLHLVFAIGVLILSVAAFWARRLSGSRFQTSQMATSIVGILIVVQLMLGVGTWITKYHWPFNSDHSSLFAGLLIVEKSLMQTTIVTAHVATGSLILMTSTVMMMQACKCRIGSRKQRVAAVEEIGVSMMGVQA